MASERRQERQSRRERRRLEEHLMQDLAQENVEHSEQQEMETESTQRRPLGRKTSWLSHRFSTLRRGGRREQAQQQYQVPEPQSQPQPQPRHYPLPQQHAALPEHPLPQQPHISSQHPVPQHRLLPRPSASQHRPRPHDQQQEAHLDAADAEDSSRFVYPDVARHVDLGGDGVVGACVVHGRPGVPGHKPARCTLARASGDLGLQKTHKAHVEQYASEEWAIVHIRARLGAIVLMLGGKPVELAPAPAVKEAPADLVRLIVAMSVFVAARLRTPDGASAAAPSRGGNFRAAATQPHAEAPEEAAPPPAHAVAVSAPAPEPAPPARTPVHRADVRLSDVGMRCAALSMLANILLAPRGRRVRAAELASDLRDGTVLLHLFDVLFGDPPPLREQETSLLANAAAALTERGAAGASVYVDIAAVADATERSREAACALLWGVFRAATVGVDGGAGRSDAALERQCASWVERAGVRTPTAHADPSDALAARLADGSLLCLLAPGTPSHGALPPSRAERDALARSLTQDAYGLPFLPPRIGDDDSAQADAPDDYVTRLLALALLYAAADPLGHLAAHPRDAAVRENLLGALRVGARVPRTPSPALEALLRPDSGGARRHHLPPNRALPPIPPPAAAPREPTPSLGVPPPPLPPSESPLADGWGGGSSRVGGGGGGAGGAGSAVDAQSGDRQPTRTSAPVPAPPPGPPPSGAARLSPSQSAIFSRAGRLARSAGTSQAPLSDTRLPSHEEMRRRAEQLRAGAATGYCGVRGEGSISAGADNLIPSAAALARSRARFAASHSGSEPFLSRGLYASDLGLAAEGSGGGGDGGGVAAGELPVLYGKAWFGALNRAEAEGRLRACGENAFVVRPSTSVVSSFALTRYTHCSETFRHYLIKLTEDKLWFVQNAIETRLFASIDQLVEECSELQGYAPLGHLQGHRALGQHVS